MRIRIQLDANTRSNENSRANGTPRSLRTWGLLAALLVGPQLVTVANLSAAHAASSTKEGPKETEKLATASQSETDTQVPAGLAQMLANSQFYSPYAFVVDKKARILSVWHQTTAGLKKVASFPADLGKNDGDKKQRNDARTPEGIYFLQTRLEGATLDFNLYGKRAFTTDYPNFFDRMEGKTGSGIWLHAVPDKVPLTRGSRGCVVVRNEVILDLTQYITLGRFPLLIQNQTELIPAKDAEKFSGDLAQWIEDWRASWERKDIDAYITHYGDDFRSMNMNKSQWKDYKTRLSAQYKEISVKISKPAVFLDRDRAVVRFIQEYTSDQHSDFGEKILFLKKGPQQGNYRIVGETWAPENSQLARDEIEAARRASSSSACGEGEMGNAGCVRSNAGVHQANR